jgi:hypothetical protein
MGAAIFSWYHWWSFDSFVLGPLLPGLFDIDSRCFVDASSNRTGLWLSDGIKVHF